MRPALHVLWINEEAGYAGGAERHVAGVATLLAGRGFTSTLLYGPDRPPDPDFTGRFDAAFPMVDVGRQVADIGPDVMYVHQSRGTGLARDLSACGVPTIRFFHDHGPFCLRNHKYTTIGHRTCRRPAGPYCYVCLGFVGRGKGGRGLALNTLRRLRAELDANRSFSAFVTGSEYMKGHIVAHGFDASKVHVLHPFVRPSDGTPPESRDPGRLLFVGALIRGKGLDVLLDALAAIPHRTALDVVGDGPQESMFRDRCARLGLDARVSFLGSVDGADLDALYRRTACVVVPSREPETFGMVGPEALGHGTPVIASDAGGMNEWLKDGRTGLAFRSCDAGDLASAIRRMLDDPREAARMGESGRELVRTRFSTEDHIERLVGIMEAVVGEG